MPSKFTPHILLFTVNLIYAGNYTIAKWAMPEFITPQAFIVLRAATGTLLFYIIHAIWIKEKIDPKDWIRLVFCGMFGIAINQLMFFKGLSITNPINASLIMILVPILVLIFSALSMKERVTFIKVLGVISGLVGAALIILSGSSLGDISISRGDLYIFINATSYSLYLIIVKSMMKKYEAFTVMRWVFFFGFLMVLPFGYDEIGLTQWSMLPGQVWFAIAYVLIGTTILAYLLNAFALKISTATLVSTYIYLQPLLAALIAILAGSDKLSGSKVLAGLFIFAGVFFVSTNTQTLAKWRK